MKLLMGEELQEDIKNIKNIYYFKPDVFKVRIGNEDDAVAQVLNDMLLILNGITYVIWWAKRGSTSLCC